MAAKVAKTKVVRKLWADGRTEEVEQEMTLQEMQAFVGGSIEMVGSNLPHRALIVDDEGTLKRKPFNAAATILVRQGVMMLGGIRGDALLVKPR